MPAARSKTGAMAGIVADARTPGRRPAVGKPVKLRLTPPFRVMSHIMNAQLRKLTDALKPLGLTGPLWRILSEIESSETANIRDLARRTALERSNVSRLVDRLIAEGLVESVDPSDRRMHVVRLSEQGRDRYREAADLVSPLNQVTVSVFTQTELDQLNRMLERLAIVLGASTD